MGITFTPSVSAWLRENKFIPSGDNDIGSKTDNILSDTATCRKVAFAFVDLDTKIHQLLSQFKWGESHPSWKIVGHYANVLAPVLKRNDMHKTKRVIAVNDSRCDDILTPRREVAIERAKNNTDPALETATIDFDTAICIDPNLADRIDKRGFRTFLTRQLVKKVLDNFDGSYTGVEIAILGPDNKLYGTPSLCKQMTNIVRFPEGDTRIPAAICQLKEAGIITADDSIAIWTNDSDILWVGCTVMPLAAIHLHRPPHNGKQTEVIDLAKLYRVVNARYTCGYDSWLFWHCIFRKTDYTTPPAGLFSIGGNSEPLYRVITFDLENKRLSINRRFMRSLLLRMPPSVRPSVVRHLTRLVWSAAFYVLFEPSPHEYGWTQVPFEFIDTGILRLDQTLHRNDNGWIDLFF